MASVEVFVDDAVRGRLPSVCAATGTHADGKLRIESARGGIGLAGLLVFLGPLGWIVLAVLLVVGARREVLTVRLPYSEAAVDRERRIQRVRLVAGLVAAGCAIGAFAIRPSPFVSVFVVAVIVAVGVAVAAHVRLWWIRARVELDASRRWVTLSNVHPDFAQAVRASAARSDADH